MAASLEYFDKVKLKGNDPARLQERYQEATKGLDKDVAFEALEGGRVFDTGDRERYDELMAKRGQAKETAQVVKAEPKKETEESSDNAQTFLNSKTQENINDSKFFDNVKGSSGVNTQQKISQDRVFGDNKNTIGDDNNFYGNVNQGNQDFSVNIANQQSGSRGSGGGLSNMQSAAAYNALNENSYERSRAKFSASGRAQKAIDMAADNSKVNEFVDNSNTASEMMRKFYGDKANNYMVGMFGDRYKSTYRPPTFKPAEAPSKIESTYGS